jgi:hypothetical protein
VRNKALRRSCLQFTRYHTRKTRSYFLTISIVIVLISHIDAGVKVIWIAERSIVDWESVAARVSDNRKNWR